MKMPGHSWRTRAEAHRSRRGPCTDCLNLALSVCRREAKQSQRKQVSSHSYINAEKKPSWALQVTPTGWKRAIRA